VELGHLRFWRWQQEKLRNKAGRTGLGRCSGSTAQIARLASWPPSGFLNAVLDGGDEAFVSAISEKNQCTRAAG
jgi:hypothetical protein